MLCASENLNFVALGPESIAKAYEKYQLNKRWRRKIVWQQISHLRWLNGAVRLGVLRTLLECLMHSRGRTTGSSHATGWQMLLDGYGFLR